MMPISDVEDYPMITPIFTIGLIAANVIIYFFRQPHLGGVVDPAQIPPNVEWFYDQYAVVPAVVSQGRNLLSVITAMFLHGNLMHIFSNMLYLWIFGNNIEHALGHVRFLVFYLLCGVAATVAQVALDPTSEVWNLGASGAIAGVLAAYLAILPHARVNVLLVLGFFYRMTKVRAIFVIGFWFVLQLLSGTGELMMIRSGMPSEGGVAYWAHIGGFVAGLFLILVMRPRVRYDGVRLTM